MASNGIDLSQGWTESSSRNPELWMAAFNNGATQTGTAVGVVTDTNGNPVAGLKITGVQKPGSATHGTYDYSETYDATNENPDDLLVENFATTDVASGTYHLYAYKISDGSLYRYLGWHTFEAGRTTYVGLSPNYLPNVDNLGAQTSTITVRNNNGSRTARANTTFLWYSGTVHSQQQNSIAPNATLTISAPTNFFGSALVVGSDDLSVAVETIYNDGGRHLADMYPGVTSSRISTAMYAPLILRNWPHLNSSWRQTTDLYIFNPSSQAASVTATFYDSYGTTDPPHVELRTIPAGGVVTIPGTELPTWEGGSISGSLASARITSNVPVAVVVRNWVGTSTLGSITTPYLSSSYRGFAASEADSTVYFPLAANQWVGAYDSGFQIQNISSSPKTVTVRFYKEGDPNPQGSAVNLTIGAYQSANVWRPSGLPQLYGSAIAEVSGGGNDIVAVAQYEDTRISQSKYGLTLYEAISDSNRSPVLPRFRRSSPWNWTGIMAQNMSTATNGVTLGFYSTTGSLHTSQAKSGVLSRTSTLFFNEIPAIEGSAQVTSTPAFGLMVNLSRQDVYTNQDNMMGYGVVK